MHLGVDSVFALVITKNILNTWVSCKSSVHSHHLKFSWSLLSQNEVYNSKSLYWVSNRDRLWTFPHILHRYCVTPSCRIPVAPHSETWNFLLDHRISWCVVLYQYSCEDKPLPSPVLDESCLVPERLTLEATPLAPRRPQLDDAPVSVFTNCSRSCWYSFFTLGVVPSFVIWWRYCVTVYVDILVVWFPRDHCCAINWLLFRALRCSKRFVDTIT